MLDDNQLYVGNFYEDIILLPYSILINITDDNYDEIEGSHQLTIALIDFYNRETIKIYTIVVDFTIPSILPSISVDTQIISNNAFELALYNELSSKNNHTITITATDDYGIDKVFLIISGNGINATFEMIHQGQLRALIETYYLTIDLNSYILGDYNITITVIDLAKNSYKVTLKMTLVPPENIPWFQWRSDSYDKIVFL